MFLFCLDPEAPTSPPTEIFILRMFYLFKAIIHFGGAIFPFEQAHLPRSSGEVNQHYAAVGRKPGNPRRVNFSQERSKTTSCSD